MFRSLLRNSKVCGQRRAVQITSRSIYTVPEIENIDEFRNQGMPGLYSAEGLQKAWYSRAQHYVNKLNENGMSEGAVSESLDHIIGKFHNEPKKKALYENASLLYNSKFALECLAPISNTEKYSLPPKATVQSLLKTPSLEYKYPNQILNKKLEDWITDSFGSVNEFRTLLLNSAEAIKGDGFVWLVAEAIEAREVNYQDLYLLNTYNAGQPNNNAAQSLDDLRFMYQKSLEQKLREEESGGLDSSPVEEPTTKKFSFKSTVFDSLEEAQNAFYDKKPSLFPLLAIDASPKAYLYDYGVFGKRVYLERVWECIDWDKIASRLPERSTRIEY